MIRPPRPARTIRCAARWMHTNAPSRSAATVWRHWSRVSSSSGAPSPVPALLTNTSTPPSSSASASITSPHPARSVVSSRATAARRPVARTSSAVAEAPGSSSCQVMPTSIPAAASATAIARPIPESEPVTIAVRGAKVDWAVSGAAASVIVGWSRRRGASDVARCTRAPGARTSPAVRARRRRARETFIRV